MTREEAINILDDYDVNFDGHTAEKIAEAFNTAIKALKEQENSNSIRINFVGEEEAQEFKKYLKNQQPCDDAISRKAVLDYIDKMPSELTADGRRIIRRRTLEEYISDTLPPVTPQPKMGRWIRVDKDKLKCSECETIHFIAQYPQSANINYCPNCGCLMKGEGEKEH
jgi:hypothetical protein